MPTVIHLRAETKPLERRSPRTFSNLPSITALYVYITNKILIVSPKTAKALLEAGFVIHVERSPDRIYKDDEYKAVGAEIVPTGSWVNAPLEHIILGLKELPISGGPLSHTTIHFQHAFKGQDGAAEVLTRYARGGGTLYDLEFLTNENGQRVAAFSYWAGYSGAAIAYISWAHQILNPETVQGPLPIFESAPALANHVKSILGAAVSANKRHPRIIVIGALGRCGKGVIDFCRTVDIPEESILKWDMAETSHGGPFKEIAESDIVRFDLLKSLGGC
jgi:saccharopine dehydrogenase (NAD+, L-lysine-forming)